MGYVDRRSLLKMAAVSVLTATALPATARARSGHGAQGAQPAAHQGRDNFSGVVTHLPGDGRKLALTIDDGTSTAVVAAFARFCRDSGVRLTFFPNGVNPSWTANAPLLRPMVESGQIQLGNHTWSHPKLPYLGTKAVADQIRRNADFLRKTYGTDGAPYFRPPYGLHNAATDQVAADLGYTTIALWSATIGDSRTENATQLISHAHRSFQPQQIILGHANQTAVTRSYSQLLDIIISRGLQTVTLADVFGPAR